jgi:phosphatidylinositol alpha-1,6-mannosyltransferase
MKFLLMTNDFYPNNIGGMTHYYTGMAGGFPNGSLTVLTVQADRSFEGDQENQCVVRVPVTGKQSGSFFSKKIIRNEAFRIIRENKIDVILCGNVRPYGDIAFDLHKKTGLPYYIFFHGNDLLRILNRMKRFFLKRITYGNMLRHARGFIANSRYVMDLIPEHVKKDKSLIVANPGVDKSFEHLTPQPPFSSPGPKRLLTVGRLTHRKGIQTVIKALPRIRQDFPDVMYDVVGAGDQTCYRKIADEYDVSDHVTFHGFTSYDGVKDCLNTCDVFIMVSYASTKKSDVEGFGIVFLEANAFGKPVIGSRTGGIEDAVIHHQTGLLVEDPFSEKEVADSILWLFRNPDKAVDMGQAGFDRVNKAFRYDVIVSHMTERIKKDLGSPR